MLASVVCADGLRDAFLNAAGTGMDAERSIDLDLLRLRPRAFPNLERPVVPSLESDGEAILAFQLEAKRVPAVPDTGLPELRPNQLHCLISQHGNEQVAFCPGVPAVENRTKSQFGLQGPKCRLDIGQAGIGVPQALRVPVQQIGSQAGDAGNRERASRLGVFLPGQGGGPVLVIDLQFQIVMMADFPMPFLQPAHALPHPFRFLGRAWLGQAVVKTPKLPLKPFAQRLGHLFLSLRAFFRMAVQERLAVRFRDRSLDPHPVFRVAGLDVLSLARVEPAMPAAAHDHIIPFLIPQPFQLFFRGDAAIHHHHGFPRRLEILQHVPQGLVFPLVAGVDPRAPHHAAGVQRQGESQQAAVRAPLFGMAERGLVLLVRRPLEIGVRQVIKRDGGLEVKEAHGPVEKMGLDSLAMPHQQVRGAIQPHRRLAIEIQVQQLAGRAAKPQPLVCGAFRRGSRHAGDNRCQRDPVQGSMVRQLVQQLWKPQLFQRPQRDVLHAHGAAPAGLQGIYPNFLNVIGFRAFLHGGGLAGPQPLGDLLGGPLKGGVFGLPKAQLGAAAAQGFRPLNQFWPLFPGDGKMPAEVEQGLLANLAVDPNGLHQPEGGVGGVFRSGARGGLSNVHGEAW